MSMPNQKQRTHKFWVDTTVVVRACKRPARGGCAMQFSQRASSRGSASSIASHSRLSTAPLVHRSALQRRETVVQRAPAVNRNLVVAVDHTESSYKAVQWTLQNLYREGDVLHLLHVVPSSSNTHVTGGFGLGATLPPEEGLQDQMAEHARQYFQQNFLSLAQQHGAACELDLVHGSCNQSVSNTILRKVEELSASVVVLSEQRRGFLDGLFQTPIAHQVAEQCRRPTMVLNQAVLNGMMPPAVLQERS